MPNTPEAPFVLPCARYCHFRAGNQECGDAVQEKDPDCTKIIEERTHAISMKRLYSKVAGLYSKTDELMGKIRAGNVWLDSELNF